MNFITIPLPESKFDSQEATVQRIQRISVERVFRIKQLAKTGAPELYNELAEVYPEWAGVLDLETGQELDMPSENNAVFRKLDYTEQLPWFLEEGLAYSPNRARRISN